MSDDDFRSLRRRVSTQTRAVVEGEIARWLEVKAGLCDEAVAIGGPSELTDEYRKMGQLFRGVALAVRDGGYRK